MKKIGIVRGLMPRLTQAEFAKSFTKFEPTFISGGIGERGEIVDFCKKVSLSHVDLPLKKPYLIDPIGFFTGELRHQSWVVPRNKEMIEACEGLDVLETYELYHFL